MPETLPDSVADAPEQGSPLPGLVIVFSRATPRFHVVALRRGSALTLGREEVGGVRLDDEKMSTRHAEVRWREGGFTVSDLGSRNGTFLDGVRLEAGVDGRTDGVLRLGQTLALLVADLRPFMKGGLTSSGGVIVGPSTRPVLERAAVARQEGGHLVVWGESGAGKEPLARRFHAAVSPPGPLVEFNCANLQPGLAEATLFGTVKGAFTEAKDTEGLFLQASGGVLFLDEIAELDLQVQAKLLRAVETGEVQRVGEGRTRQAKVAVVAASHQRLQDRVREGRFRQDLYFRLSQFEVELPPLRARREEIPWLMHLALQGRAEALHVSAVEAAMARPWPGNVRELLNATIAAASLARGQGGVVKAEHLAPAAGLRDEAGELGALKPDEVTKELLVTTLARCEGNATKAAKELGLHRTQLNRLRAKFGL